MTEKNAIVDMYLYVRTDGAAVARTYWCDDTCTLDVWDADGTFIRTTTAKVAE
jgi:hypothetical protein